MDMRDTTVTDGAASLIKSVSLFDRRDTLLQIMFEQGGHLDLDVLMTASELLDRYIDSQSRAIEDPSGLLEESSIDWNDVMRDSCKRFRRERQLVMACLNCSLKFHSDRIRMSSFGYCMEIDVFRASLSSNVFRRNLFTQIYSMIGEPPDSLRQLCYDICKTKMYNVDLATVLLAMKLLNDRGKLKFIHDYQRDRDEIDEMFKCLN